MKGKLDHVLKGRKGAKNEKKHPTLWSKEKTNLQKKVSSHFKRQTYGAICFNRKQSGKNQNRCKPLLGVGKSRVALVKGVTLGNLVKQFAFHRVRVFQALWEPPNLSQSGGRGGRKSP